MLRPIRVGLGPSSILATLYTSATQIWIGGVGIIESIRMCFAIIIFTSTFLAGVVFRPDNLEIVNMIQSALPNALPPLLKNIPYIGSFKTTNMDLRTIHGFLNLTSVFMSLIILFTY